MSLSRNELYRFDDYVLNRLTRILVRDGVTLPLPPKAFDVLAYLVENPGRIVTKEELLTTVWPNAFVEEGNLAQHISTLRKTFADRSGYIVTVPGRGYQFSVEVHKQASTSALKELAEESREGHYIVQTSRERMRIVVEDTSPAVPKPKRWPIAVGAVVLAGFAWLGWRSARPAVPVDHHEIVLADFDNRTGDEIFNFILKNAVEIDLEQSPMLSLVSLQQTRKTLQEMGHPAEQRLTPDIAREICERNSAQAYLSGSIAALGNSYVLTLEATDCVSGKQLAKLEGQAQNRDAILQSLGDIDAKMRAKLGESLHSIQGFDVPIWQATTSSFDALVAYSRAMQTATTGLPSAEALPFLERAVQLDPKFAMAYEEIGVANGNLGNDAAEQEGFAKAYELRQPASVREQFFITARYEEVVEGDLDAAAQNLKLWASSYPLDASIWGTLGNTYTQMGNYPDAITAGRRAISLQPKSAFAYAVLSRALKRASQFAEAKTVCAAAVAHGADSWHIHSILFQIAVAEHDEAAMARESTWDKGQSTEEETLENSAWAAATEGKLKGAKQLFTQAADTAERLHLADFRPSLEGDLSLVDMELGDYATARAVAAKRLENVNDVSRMAALSAALSGETSGTKRVIAETEKTTPASSTLVRKMELPELQAAVALQENKPAVAISLLEAGRVYELRNYDLPFLRGKAYLDEHQGEKAAAEYREILANPGIDPVSPMYPLGHLGLARADAMQGKSSESRKEYEALFALWKDADSDLPVLKQARLEYAHLGGSK